MNKINSNQIPVVGNNSNKNTLYQVIVMRDGKKVFDGGVFESSIEQALPKMTHDILLVSKAAKWK